MNDAASSIAKNTTAMMGSQLITWASSFVLMIFLPRYLGAEDFGRLYFAASITGLMGSVMSLGIGDYLVKEVARDRSKASSFLSNALVLRGVAWFVSFLIAIEYVRLTTDSKETLLLVVLVGCGQMLGSLSDLGYKVFQSFERMQYRSVAVVVQQVSSVAICVALLLLGFGATAIAASGILTSAMAFGVVLIFLPRVTRMDWAITTSSWPELLRGSFPFFVTTGLSVLYYRVDVMMLSAMTNDKVVGWYGAPYRLFDTFSFFPSIVGTVVFPIMARMWQDSKDGFASIAQQTLNVTIIVAVPFAVILVSCSRQIISLLFGFEHFSNSVILLQLLAASLPLLYVDYVFATMLVSADKQRYSPIVAAVALVINVTLNYFLIAYFHRVSGNGAIGAAITTLLTELAVSGMFFSLLPAGCFNRTNLQLAVKSIASGGLMAFVIWLMGQWIQYWYLIAFVGVAVYVGILFLMKAFSSREFRFLLSLSPLRKSIAKPVQEQ